MVKLSIICVSCPWDSQPIIRLDYQLAILSPFGMKIMVSRYLMCLTDTKILETEGTGIRVQLRESLQLSLQVTSTDGKKHQNIQPSSIYIMTNVFYGWKE